MKRAGFLLAFLIILGLPVFAGEVKPAEDVKFLSGQSPRMKTGLSLLKSKQKNLKKMKKQKKMM